MSFQAMSWSVTLKLPTREKFVLLMLANYASNEVGDCFPSLQRLADDTGMSRNTVIEAIKSLEALGALTVVRRQQSGVNLPNVYRLNLAWRGGSPNEPLVQMPVGGSPPVEPEPINEPITKKKEGERVTFWEGNYTLEVPPSIMASLVAAYPGVDVTGEIARASSWLAVNPGRRPKRDFGRFLNGWLNRAAADRRQTATPRNKAERREAFMEGLFGPQGDPRVIDVAATVIA